MINYIIIKGKNGEVSIKERKENNKKPYLTSEDECFTKALDEKEIEKHFEEKPKSINKRLDKNISIVINDSKTQEEIVAVLEKIEDISLIKTMKLLEYLDKKLKELDKLLQEDESIKDRLLIVLEEKQKLIQRKKSILEIEEMLTSPENEDFKLTERIIEIIKNQIEKNNINNIQNIIEDSTKNPKIETNMNNIFRELTSARDRKQLIFIYNELLEVINDESQKNSLKRMYEKNSTLTLSIIAKSLLNQYVKNNVTNLELDDLYEIEENLSKGFKGLQILEEIDSKVTNNINPEVADYLDKQFECEIDKKLDEKSSVICYNCTNGYTSRCKKIADLDKKEIQDYPFIIRGYQVYRNERLDKFIVGECENFSLIPHYKRLTKEESKQAKKLLAELYNQKTHGEDIFTNAKKIIPKYKRI